jgi:ATP-dependent DNA helicase DinG
MAIRPAEALSDNRNLCVEAPTGIGKSFAYLVPIILYALKKGTPALITTETINLQEQLIEKDIPILQKLMGKEFKTALAKGRSNYLCIRRLQLTSGDRQSEFLPSVSNINEIDKLQRWSVSSDDGSLSSIDFKISQQTWSYVCSEGGNCGGPKCSHYKSCFYWNARKEWEKANIVVANHALFFTDLKIKQEEDQEHTLLPQYCAVIVDEAHTMEDNAAQYMGLNISNSSVQYFLNRLFNEKTGKGLLMKAGEEAMELRKAVAKIQENSFKFFNMFDQLLDEKNENIYRVRKPNLIPDILSEQLGRLRRMLFGYMKLQDDKDLKTELESQMDKCDAYGLGIYNFLNMTLDEHVYWVENENGKTSLYAAPLNVSDLLREILFQKNFPCILTSATLSVDRSLDYYKKRVGYTSGGELILDSPFNLKKQAKIYIPRNMPEPNSENYTEAVISEIKRFISFTKGKAFVLFTSYHLLRTCAEKLESFFNLNNITLLVQGEDMTRTAMLHKFRNDTNSVIFGATSFWTGVDVPGKALSNVIITKLPFAVPSHPLIQARSEKIEETGQNSFMAYSLPEAILKFRQGTGRLIRSKNDTGIVAVLDKRIISKRYGRRFLDSIPECPVEIC